MAEFVQTTLMDGYAGGPHITEAQLGLAHQATFGPDDYVLEGGRESEAQVLTNNSIRIFDAVYCIQGRRDVIPASGYTDVTIDNGTQGMNRNDIIVRRYKKDEVSEEESTEYAVIKGTPSSGEAVDPSVTTGDIRSGAILHEMKLYRVKLTGLNIVEVEPLFNILKNQATLQKEIAQSNKDLSNKLTELNGKSGILISADQNNPITEYQLYKMGKMVVFNVTNYKKGQGAVNGRVIGTIQEGFLPPHTIAISFGTSGADQFDSSGNPGSRIFVNDAGVVTLYCNKNTGNYISFTACWVTD